MLELIVLTSIVKKYNPKTIFEIGTGDGGTTLNLALNSSPSATVYTLDLPTEKGIGSKFTSKSEAQNPAKKKIQQLLGDSTIFDYSPYFNSIDMVFIDDGHSYEHVESNTNVALKLLKDGKGIIIYHDYVKYYPGVVKFLHKFKSEHLEYALFHIQGTTMAILHIE